MKKPCGRCPFNACKNCPVDPAQNEEKVPTTRYIFDLDAWENNTTPDAKEWVEEQFPEKHYGKDILIYEAWDMRALLEQAYMAGKESK